MTRTRGEAGVVFAEFLIAFPVVFVMFLAIVQLSLLSAASLIVRHAAYRAAHKASIVLDDDPKRYDESPRMRLRQPVKKKGGLKQQLRSFVSRSGNSSAEPGPRMKKVTRAAYVPLAALAPPASVPLGWAKGTTPALADGALDMNWTVAASALLYTPRVTTVRFVGKAEQGPIDFQPGEILRVRVTYLYPCSVPLVNRLICRSMLEVDNSLLQSALDRALPLPQVWELSGEASAAIHQVPYLYRSESEDKK